jgi:hypothetical protein
MWSTRGRNEKMRGSTPGTPLDFVQRLERDQTTQAVPKKCKSLIISQMRQHSFCKIVSQTLDALIGFLVETAFSARQLNNDYFYFRPQLLLPTAERRGANARMRHTEKPDYLPVRRWSDLEQGCHVMEVGKRNCE